MQRHSDRPPQAQGPLSRLLNVLRKKPGEEKSFYEFLQRLHGRSASLTDEEQKRVYEIWAIVASATLSGKASTASSSIAAPVRCDAAPTQTSVDVRATAQDVSAVSWSVPSADASAAARARAKVSGVKDSGADLPLWCRPEWGEFEDDRRQLRELVAWVRDNSGANPGSRNSQWQPYWSKAKKRCTQSTGPRPRDRQFPEGVQPLINCIERMVDEYPR